MTANGLPIAGLGSDGEKEDIGMVTDAAKVANTGKKGTPHMRELLTVNKAAAAGAAAASDLHTATWVEAEDVTEVTVTCAAGKAVTSTAVSRDDGIYVCFDAPSDGTAAAWLSAVESANSDSQRFFVELGKSRTFRFQSAILRADCVASDNSTTNDFDVVMEAV